MVFAYVLEKLKNYLLVFNKIDKILSIMSIY